MGGIVSSVAAMFDLAESRVEAAAQNLANVTTPGFKRHVFFHDAMRAAAGDAAPLSADASDLSQGQITETGAPTDLALSGPGFFVVRTDDGLRYTRAGHFTRDEDGRVHDASGAILQMRGGGDVIVSGKMQVFQDGTIADENGPLGRLWIANFDAADAAALPRDAHGFVAPDGLEPIDAETTLVRQGAIEASNVSNAAEMLAIMEALRQAESGQRVMHVYDDLLAKALTTFGQN